MANKKIGRKSSAQDNFLEPSAVTSLSATNVGTDRGYNNGGASLTWSLPAASPPATLYTITSTPATTTQTSSSTSYTFTGLTSATAYTFTVVASNAAGSAQSTTSNSITATTVPQAPSASASTSAAGPTPTPATGYDRITFSGNATGGSAITSYRITTSARGEISANATSPFDTASPNAETYTVFAVNANGSSLGATTSDPATFTPPHFPPFFPPFFPPHFPPFFPPFFPPHFVGGSFTLCSCCCCSGNTWFC